MCADIQGNEGPIPDQWKRDVIRVLRTNSKSAIQVAKRAHAEWFATFPDSWRSDLFDALRKRLEDPDVTGKPVDMPEKGVVYAFFFYFRGRKMYGKIGLLPNGRIIFILSAHPPFKGDSL